MVENLGVLSLKNIFFSLISLQKASQGINSNIGLFLMVVNFKIILREFLSPPDLSKTQVLGIYKATKIVVVSKDKDFIFAMFQIVAPILEGFNNGQ